MARKSRVQKIFGVPGSGKTTYLLDTLEKVIEAGTPPERIAYLTFTRHARLEAKGRVIQRFGFTEEQLIYFRTIHSICFQQLGLSQDLIVNGRVLREFSAKYGFPMTLYGGTKSFEEDNLFAEGMGTKAGDKFLAFDHWRRHKMLDFETAYKRWPESLIYFEVEQFTRVYKQWREEEGLTDFTDFLEEAKFPLDVDIVFVDEAQDLSDLQHKVVNMFASNAREIYYAGDDDQCQPAGTLVQTTRGQIRIEQLDPARDKVISYDRRGSAIRRTGSTFKKSYRKYTGHMYQVIAGAKTSFATDNHRWLVKWTPEAKTAGHNVVYLMRKKNFWRIGWCQLFNSEGVSHLNIRRNGEQAEDVWILRVCDSKSEASLWESFYAAQYGITTASFKALNGSTLYTQPFLDNLHTMLNRDTEETLSRVDELLGDTGNSIKFPFLEKGKQTKYGNTINEVVSCNLLSGLMQVPVYNGTSKVDWEKIEVKREWVYDRRVYSLAVTPNETYVADGIVTHNCIFQWAGASAEIFIDMPGKVKVLEKSWRMPETIGALSQRIVKQIGHRQPKNFAPRTDPGLVSYYDSIDTINFTKDETWKILVRNNYLKKSIMDTLTMEGVPYSNNGVFAVDSQTLHAMFAWERLRKGGSISFGEASDIYNHITTRIGVEFGAKKKLDDLRKNKERQVTFEELQKSCGLLLSREVPWYEALSRIDDKESAYLRSVGREYGSKLFADVLDREKNLKKDIPGVVDIYSIHAAKGSEADNVVLLGEMAGRCADQLSRDPDPEIRVWYTAVSRAKQQLMIVGGNELLNL